MQRLVDPEHARLNAQVRETLATYAEQEDLINIGAYKKGSNPKVDAAIDSIDRVNRFLRQDRSEAATFEQTREQMAKLFVKGAK
jgi:flagellum-specific ATP synthase